MFEFILFIAIFVGIMAVSVLVFGGWFLVMLVRGVAAFFGMRSTPQPPPLPHAAAGLPRPSGAVQTGPVDGQRVCAYELCRATNDGAARFCRRCGRKLAAPAQVHVRRAAAAVW